MSLLREFAVPAISLFLTYSLGDTKARDSMSGPAASGVPVIRPGGVVNAATFEPGIAQSAWVSILGSNLASSTRTWSESDFSGDKLPTALDGVSIRFNGTPGYVSYISPAQINALVPDNGVEGVVQVQVFTPEGTSQAVETIVQKMAPAFFAWDAGEHQYVAGVHADGDLVGPAVSYSGIAMRPAKPGEIVMLFGNGFGATEPRQPPSDLVRTPVPLAVPVVGRIGDKPAEVAYAALVLPGLYQFNVMVPEISDGDQAVLLDAGGFQTQRNLSIPVQRAVAAPSKAIIVDHTNTDITQVPEYWIDRARQNLKLYYGHTSHGSQITNGLQRLESQYGSKYAVAAGEYLPTRSGALAILEAGTYDWDPDFYPTVPRILSANPAINVVMFMWCGQPATATWQTVLEKYLSDMQTLERNYPKVTFVYTTGQAQDKDCPGCVRQKFNEQLRQFARNNNKVLFDFGDLDVWYNGQMQTYPAPSWCSTYGCTPGAAVPSEHPQWGGGDYNNPCGHATYASCDNKGRAMWWLLARIAGWDGAVAAPATRAAALSPAITPAFFSSTPRQCSRFGN